MNMYFAHAGEVHETVTAATSHSLFSRWYVLLPAYVVALCAVGYVAYRLSRRSVSFTYNLLLAILLISGMLGYTHSVPVSVFSLSVGFAMALLQVMIGLGGAGHKTETTNE